MGRNVHRVLIDQGSSTDVMFWDTFVGLQVPRDQLQPFDGVLVGFSGEQVEVRGHVDLRTTFSDENAAKTIVIRYLVVNAPSSYNLLLGRPSLNKLGAVISTSHMKMKFPTEGKIVTMKVDQEIARKCYENSLRTRRTYALAQTTPTPINNETEQVELDPRAAEERRGPKPVGDLKEIEISSGRKVKIGSDLDPKVETELCQVLRSNLTSFAWTARDMPGINPDVICHRLNVNPGAKAKVQRRRRLNEEKAEAAAGEILKLQEAGHIKEIQYPEWLANIVMVKKANGKWRMCVDFTNLNTACPKDSYPLPNIDTLVDRVSGCGLLSFMDAYSGYNQIRMHPEDEDKTAFMGIKANFCYLVMPFGLKNAGATYQRMMDRILQPMLGRNVEAYVDDMVVTSTREGSHADDLQELFDTINKYQLRLSPEKCVFGVKAGKFLGFMLTERGIEANPDKCMTIINMKSPSSVCEVQQLTGRMAALARFLARSGDKGHPYFQCLQKNNKFPWTPDCEQAFTELKEYLCRPPVLSRPELGIPLQMYITVTEYAISSVLVQEKEGAQRPIYFVSRLLRGAEKRYPTLEKAALAIRNLPYLELRANGNTSREDGTITKWILSIDGSSNQRGSGAGVVLEGPGGVLVEQSLKFSFKTSNNQAEYEALAAGILLAKEMGVQHLTARSDSLLVTGQVNGDFAARDPQLARYLEYVKSLAATFTTFELVHVPREDNNRADLLSKLASCTKPGQQKSVIKETLKAPRVSNSEKVVVMTSHGNSNSETWMTLIKAYLADGVLPSDPTEANRIKRSSTRYTLLDGHLFRLGFSRPILTCIKEEEAKRILTELHEGICRSHIGGRALMLRTLRAGYFWPTMKKDCAEFVQRCDQCQRHSNLHMLHPRSYILSTLPGPSTPGTLTSWDHFH
ncbi:uncharacterized protein LOC114165580 [Vigna unguiculata]|uniref:uncharacterized protein LOC114165580 n=1 Tax=Vigna unguiculata TaxID=3917 RepID=UPI001016D9C1|nr:uncharacterized protein LOC114165580 [Vigna unguiculata]